MRYNLTLDDSIVATLEAEARSKNIAVLELIKNTLAEKYPSALNLEKDKFKIIYLKKISGKLFEVGNKKYIISFEENKLLSFITKINRVHEIPEFLDSFIYKSGKINYLSSNGTFTALQLDDNKYIVCFIDDGVSVNVVSDDTIKKATPAGTWILTAVEIANNFQLTNE